MSRQNKSAHKNDFGHVLVIAGSRRMLGAGALACLSALRSGAGLVTFGIPKSFNSIAQKLISNCVMTLPLEETKNQAISSKAFYQIEAELDKFDCIAIGPGLGTETSTQNLVYKIIESSNIPLVIDADALNAIALNKDILLATKTPKVLTPHPGEMARLSNFKKSDIEDNRKSFSMTFATMFNCILLLKGTNTIVSHPNGKTYTNRTGNAGMATAGSGDVLTGMIAAFISQGLEPFDSAKLGAYLHGKAGDIAAKKKTKIAMIASDICDNIPDAIKESKK